MTIRKLLIISLLFFYFSCFGQVVKAASCVDVHGEGFAECNSDCRNLGSEYSADPDASLCEIGQVCCYKTSSGKNADPAQLQLQVPLFGYTQTESLSQFIGEIFRVGLILLVPISIIMIIYAGVSWILSRGDPGKIKTAKNHISSAFIGLFIGIFSYMLLSFVGIKELKEPNVEYIEPIYGGLLYMNGQIISPGQLNYLLPPENRGEIHPDYWESYNSYLASNKDEEALSHYDKIILTASAQEADSGGPCPSDMTVSEDKIPCGSNDSTETAGKCCYNVETNKNVDTSTCTSQHCGGAYSGSDWYCCDPPPGGPAEEAKPCPSDVKRAKNGICGKDLQGYCCMNIYRYSKEELSYYTCESGYCGGLRYRFGNWKCCIKGDKGTSNMIADTTCEFLQQDLDPNEPGWQVPVTMTEYYKPAYHRTPDFFCKVPLQCWCPNNNKKVGKCCVPFSDKTDYCISYSGEVPQADYTLAGDPKCFKMAREGGEENNRCLVWWNGQAYRIHDAGGKIKGNHLDVFKGTRENDKGISSPGSQTITILNPVECIRGF
ncbi:MAG: hypothetical protein NTZ49_03490 [Candidatus Parcubacteria bacterium]|nr:hypothetical protein [Candidatus Parcubacteria bacterium]